MAINDTIGAGGETYQVLVRSSTISLISIGLIPELSAKEQQSAMFMRELRPGLESYAKVTRSHPMTYFTFRAQRKENIQSLQINLTPIRGKFIILLSNDPNKRPTLETAQWRSYDNTLTIDKSDVFFASEGVYTIGLHAIFDEGRRQHHEADFRIKLTPSSMNSLLTPGIIEYGILHRESQLFVIEIHPDQADIMIFKSPSTNPLIMEILTPDNSYDQNYRKLWTTVSTEVVGFKLNRSDMQNFLCSFAFKYKMRCNVFISLKGKPGQKYSIGYTFDRHAITLTKNNAFYAPIPMNKAAALKFVYHADNSSYFDLEVSSNMPLIVRMNIGEDGELGVTFPTAEKQFVYSSSDSGFNIISMAREEMDRFKNPVAYITVEPKYLNFSDENSYYFRNYFTIEASTDMKELIKTTPKQVYLDGGVLKYLYFYHDDPYEPISIEMHPLSDSSATIFVSKGLESRPTQDRHQYTCNHVGTCNVRVDKLHKNEHPADDDMANPKGYWVVGVYSKQSGLVSVVWKHSSNRTIRLNIGQLTKLTLLANSSSYLSLQGWDVHYISPIAVMRSDRPVQVSFIPLKDSSKSTDPSSINEVDPTPTIIYDPRDVELKQLDSAYSCLECTYFLKVDNKQSQDANFELILDADKPILIDSSASIFWKLNRTNHDFKFIIIPQEKTSRQDGYPRNLNLHILMLTGGQGTLTLVGSTGKNDVSHSISQSFQSISLHSLLESYPDSINGTIKCEQKCTFEVKLYNPDKVTKLGMNKVVEGVIGSHNGDFPATYVYESDGKEHKLEFYFTIEWIRKLNPIKKEFHNLFEQIKNNNLLGVFEIFHTQSKAEAYEPYIPPSQDPADTHSVLTTSIKPLHVTEEGNYIHYEFTPREGYWVIRVKREPIDDALVSYRIELLNRNYRELTLGKYTVGEVKHSDKQPIQFASYVDEPGDVFYKINNCYGQLDGELSVGKHKSTDSYKLNTDSNGLYERLKMTPRHEQLFMSFNWKGTNYDKMSPKDLLNLPDVPGYIDPYKTISIFGFELIQENSRTNQLFTTIRASARDIQMNLYGATPNMVFNALILTPDDRYEYSIKYTVVLSRDPHLTHYYSKCGKKYLHDVLKDKYKSTPLSSLIQVSSLLNILHSVDSIQPPLQSIPLNLTRGVRYFGAVFADVHVHDKQVGRG